MLALGVDIGTSGVRSAVIDETGLPVSQARAPHPAQAPGNVDAELWWVAVKTCLVAQVAALRDAGLDPLDIGVAAVDGTSGSMVLVDAAVRPVTRGLMYDSAGFEVEAKAIRARAPENHITQGSNSALARLLRLLSEDRAQTARNLCHQADFIMARLTGRAGHSDHNNALKTGFDPETGAWPVWFDDLGIRPALLPRVLPAGQSVGRISARLAAELGLSTDLIVKAGTTDSIAAYLATGARGIGTAVTSLGTTLAIKMLSPVRVDDPSIGLYSHRLGAGWLAGGASNTGGGVLRSFFAPDELARLSAGIEPDQDSGLDYYPLLRPGERFPINDPDLPPRLTPRPDEPARFLHGLLQGIARIEAQCFGALEQRGAGQVKRILTVGGGAGNETWRRIREREIGVPIENASGDEASIGAALLALRAL